MIILSKGRAGPRHSRQARPPKVSTKAERQIEDRLKKILAPSMRFKTVCRDGFLFRTSRARVIGHKSPDDLENGKTAYLLILAGRFFMQVESLFDEIGQVKELTKSQAVALWNACDAKLSAVELLKDDTPLPLNQRG